MGRCPSEGLIPWSHPILPNPFEPEPVRELQGSLVVMIAVAGALGCVTAAFTDWLSPKKQPLSGPEAQAMGLIPKAICVDFSAPA